jgi:hypothetical protein
LILLHLFALTHAQRGDLDGADDAFLRGLTLDLPPPDTATDASHGPLINSTTVYRNYGVFLLTIGRGALAVPHLQQLYEIAPCPTHALLLAEAIRCQNATTPRGNTDRLQRTRAMLLKWADEMPEPEDPTDLMILHRLKWTLGEVELELNNDAVGVARMQEALVWWPELTVPLV